MSADAKDADQDNSRRESPARLREEELEETAIRIFYEKGYASASVQMIADEMGILKGSVYHYIRGKEDLLYQILSRVYEELGKILQRARSKDASNPIKLLAFYIEEQVRYSARNRDLVAIYYRDSQHLAPKHRAEIDSQRREHQAFVRGLLIDAQKVGLLPPEEDPQVVANLIFGSFIWTYRWYDIAGKRTPNEIAKACARFAIRGVAGRTR